MFGRRFQSAIDANVDQAESAKMRNMEHRLDEILTGGDNLFDAFGEDPTQRCF